MEKRKGSSESAEADKLYLGKFSRYMLAVDIHNRVCVQVAVKSVTNQISAGLNAWEVRMVMGHIR